MTILTSDEQSLICLALDEWASGFSLAFGDDENDKARTLADRLRHSVLQAEDTP